MYFECIEIIHQLNKLIVGLVVRHLKNDKKKFTQSLYTKLHVPTRPQSITDSHRL